MDTITVDKAKLLEIIKGNRDRHRQVFEDALDGYRKYAQEVLEEHMTDLMRGKTPEIRISIARPQDHTADYDRVIQMIEMDKGSEFTLDENDFSQYVRDDWNWKRQWLASSNTYAAASTQQAYGSADSW